MAYISYLDLQTPEEIEMLSRAKAIYDGTGYYFAEGLLGVKKNKKWGFIDVNGNIIFDFIFTDRPVFEDGFARAYIGRHKCGMIDTHGNVIIDFIYDNVFPYDHDGYIKIEKGNYWGTIDREGKEHIKPSMKFQNIKSFKDGIAPAKIGTKWGLIDTEGNHITEFKYYEIEEEINGLFYTRITPKIDGYLNRYGELVDDSYKDPNAKISLTRKSLAIVFIPELLKIVSNSQQWDIKVMANKNFLINCSQSYRIRLENFSWDGLQIYIENVDSQYTIIIYDFPFVGGEFEMRFGGIIIDNDKNTYSYCTLSHLHTGFWNLTMHSPDGKDIPFGVYEITPSKENFVDILVHSAQFNFTGNVKHIFKLPENYIEIDNMPEDPKHCLNIAKLTNHAECFIQLFPINPESAMLFDKLKEQKNNIYKAISANQEIIKVDKGLTNSGKQYIYSIIKTKMEPYGVQYSMLFQVNYQSIVLNIKASFTEKGITGVRDSIVLAHMIRKGKVSIDQDTRKLIGWTNDPYDEKTSQNYKMNLSETSSFDHLFPEHPLSECREFRDYIKDNL